MKRRYIAAGVIFFLLIVSLWSVLNDFEKSKKLYRENRFGMLESKIEATTNSLSQFSQYVYDRQINIPAVTSLLNDAWTSSDQAVRDSKRRELYSLLLDDYKLMTAFNFRQLHFQFPDSRSFLRMHSPEKYGDDLSGMRATVRLANERLEKTTAFEEGRVFNGYRIVYPLFHNGEHCGSVELSFSMGAFTSILSSIDDGIYLFAVKREVVQSTVFAEDLSRYEPCSFSADYMFDKEVLPPSVARLDFLNGNQHLHHLLKEGNDGSFMCSGGENEKMVLVHHIKNVSGKPVAVLISISNDSSIAHLIRDTASILVLIFIIFSLTALAVILMIRERDYLQHLSDTDMMTSLDTRSVMYKKIQHEIDRHGRSFCIIMIDIDNFKNVNDMYGHAEGDRVLIHFASMLKKTVRGTDSAARWGGEEFLILLPETSYDEGRIVADKICSAAAGAKLSSYQSVTVSAGFAEFMSADNTDTVISRADTAMYGAKKKGKNRASGCRM